MIGKIDKIAFLGSYHTTTSDISEVLEYKSCNWVCSSLPLNEEVVNEQTEYVGCKSLSGATMQHKYLPTTAKEAVFEYLDMDLSI